MDSINSQDCVICLVLPGIHAFQPHYSDSKTLCHPKVLICTPCLRELQDRDEPCIYCRSDDSNLIISVNQQAIYNDIIPKLIKFYNFIYTHVFPVCKPAQDLKLVYRMFPLDDQIQKYIPVRTAYQSKEFRIFQWIDVLWILCIYLDFECENTQDTKKLMTISSLFIYITHIETKLNDEYTYFIEDISKDTLKQLWNIVQNDPGASSEPKYLILDMIIQLYDAFPKQAKHIYLTKEMVTLLTNVKLFRQATIKWKYYSENGQIILQRIE